MTATPPLLTVRPAGTEAVPVTVDDDSVISELLDDLRAGPLDHFRVGSDAVWPVTLPDGGAGYLLAVESGQVSVDAGQRRRRRWFPPGSVVLLPHGGPHRLRRSGDASLFVYVFRFRTLQTILARQGLPGAVHVDSTVPGAPSMLATTVRHLIAESAAAGPDARVVVTRLVDIVLIKLIRAVLSSDRCPVGTLGALADPPVATALTLVHREPAGPWTVDRLARAAGLSRSAFAARFRTAVGTTPADYLLRWRMSLAATLLHDRTMPISRVSARTGYGSEAAFNRAFKRVEGATPGEYRRRVVVDQAPGKSLGDAE
jgi:AraC-like DNA-binding protein